MSSRCLPGKVLSPPAHVTGWFYRRPDHVQLMDFSADVPATDVRLTLYTVEDARRLKTVLGAMQRPRWEYAWDETADLAGAGGC